MERPEKWVHIRIALIGTAFVAVFVLVAVRAFQLQVLHREEWQKRAERQYQKVIPLTPQRGTIYDRNRQELALSLEVDSVYIEPQKVADPNRAARALSAALDLPLAQVQTKLQSKKGFLWLKRQLTPTESSRVRALELSGVCFTKEHRRFYPNAEIGAQLLGFTGLDPEGLEGLELKYDAQLQGRAGYLVTERDALGRSIGPGENAVEGSSPGGNIFLTLDKNLQYVAEKELDEGLRAVRAKSGSVVILDPGSGEVLAMASRPSYDPNDFKKYHPSEWRNRALTDTFEPGSTIKMFLVAAALNEGVVRLQQSFDCENGTYRVGGKEIHDHTPHQRLTVGEILKYSSNIGSAKIGKVLERTRYHQYLRDFGFGQKTGVELPGEANGQLRRPNKWFEVDLAAISFGQGLTVTPVQLATAVAAIANGGKLMRPYVVERVENRYGEVIEQHAPELVRQVISPEVAAQVRELLVTVTEKGGTGTLGTVPGYRVAGKTGTSQKVDAVTGGYSADKRISSFAGFVPAEAPRLVILVMIDEPVTNVYGGLVAAPVFSRIAAQALGYLNIPPTVPLPKQELPQLPVIVQQEAGDEEETVPLPEPVPGGGPLMPDCLGMSGRQVLQTMERSGINIRMLGSGRVVEQSPGPGEQIRFGHEVSVRLAPPS